MSINTENPYDDTNHVNHFELSAVSEEEADDLLARFFLNQPQGFFKKPIDIAVAIKSAYYHHLSIHKSMKTTQPKSVVSKFAANLFNYCPDLHPYINQIPEMFLQLRKSHQNLLTCGAICLNKDLTKVLVIAHTITPNQFAFPKGKIDEGETPLLAAIRETEEEANFDVSPYILENYSFRYKRKSRADGVFFFATNVPEVELKPSLPAEICKIGWVDINTRKSDDGYSWQPDGPTSLILEDQLPAFIEMQKLKNNSEYIIQL
ncbi:hydrolase, NUDIX family protein [Trichomonas vaginalis G3]|uniref:Hydrolase, NUDIX family protein n=1 Tax=Trichomonas vaginalis (strain ATCC PRA-98 / G3) TaxID=412133 RepID=A2FIH4_TRIV3|nr:m7G(5')pppN diphosphatase protein [Trichomonas vaginalis G3]EAX95291.1 hydrolase, NUDIX family protein [Trichomonas vaginalis G3]KAI5539348.1 m7G(5')pppN diphosphatase protein [Trichomonas vaginalis G3]|eukprot:XP_001308221.1 hydrolase, NUDIX family protein [Trichomonas vaginalis G3]